MGAGWGLAVSVEEVHVPASTPGWLMYESWLRSFPKGTQATYKSRALSWFHWLQDQYVKSAPLEDPRAEASIHWIREQMPAPTWDGLVQLQKGAEGDERYAILDVLEYFVNRVMVASHGHKKGTVDTVRSFFNWNRVELPADPQFVVRADKIGAPGKLTYEVVRDIVKAATLRDRSLIMVKWMTFLDWEGLEFLNRTHGGEVAQQIRDGRKQLGPFWLPGRKHMKMKQQGRFYVLIGHDAIEALREYFDKVRGSWPAPGEPIWLSRAGGGALSKAGMKWIWYGLLVRVGLMPKERGHDRSFRSGFGGHETRDAASSLVHRAKLQGFDLDVAEFMKGHVNQIDPNKYDRFWNDEAWVTEQYQIIEPYLNIISNWQPQEIKSISKENEELRQRLAKLEGLWESILQKKITNET